MTIQQIVDPANIESELIRIWETLAKKNKMRACLFNLIVFNRLSARTDYFRTVIQKMLEKYPCRVLFISSDPDSSQSYLKTAISVIPLGAEGSIACDTIDIGVAGPDLARVPFIVFPHLVPDLPISLLWTEDPSKPHPLFEPLSRLASRIIFDSESADNLLKFAETVLALKEKTQIEIADLNWARTEGWRELLSSTFNSPQGISQLKDIAYCTISFNSRETEFFCHLKIQSMYLLGWLSSRLKWKLKKTTQELHFLFESNNKEIDVQINADYWERLGSGTIISVDLTTHDQFIFECARIPTQYHRVSIQTSSPEKCDLPYQFVLGQTATGQSLVKEIITKGTSEHYLDMLRQLIQLDRDHIC